MNETFDENLPEDLKSLIEHSMTEIESIERRISEKSEEFHQFNLLKEDFDRSIESFNESSRSRALLDHLRSLASDLTSRLSNATERDQIRRRLHDVVRRSDEMNDVSQSNGEKWLNEVQRALKENLPNDKLKQLMKNFSNHNDSIQRSMRDELRKRVETNERLSIEENQTRLNEQWLKNVDETIRSFGEQRLTFEEKLQRIDQIQTDLNKRKESMKNFPQLDKIQRDLHRLRQVTFYRFSKRNEFFVLEDFQRQHEEEKNLRQQLESLFRYLKENHQYQSISDKRDLPSLQREYQRLIDEQTRLNEKIHQIDAIRHSSRDVEYLRERFIETDKDLHRRISFLKNLIRVSLTDREKLR